VTADNARQRGPQATESTSDDAKPFSVASSNGEAVGVLTAQGAAFHYCEDDVGGEE